MPEEEDEEEREEEKEGAPLIKQDCKCCTLWPSTRTSQRRPLLLKRHTNSWCTSKWKSFTPIRKIRPSGAKFHATCKCSGALPAYLYAEFHRNRKMMENRDHFNYGPKQCVAFIALFVAELTETHWCSMDISCGYASVPTTVEDVV